MYSAATEKALSLWKEWNDRINVISRKDIDNLYEHHYRHCLALVEFMRRNDLQASSILDVGTGGGFPGIPMAIEMPQTRFTLCDSIRKKTVVASAVAAGVGLENVTVVNCRAEDIPETFDFVVSRAVASLSDFYPWIRDKYSKGILCLKGGDVMSEISDLCRKFRLPAEKITVWPIDEWLNDDYFKEKFVIYIRK